MEEDIRREREEDVKGEMEEKEGELERENKDKRKT